MLLIRKIHKVFYITDYIPFAYAAIPQNTIPLFNPYTKECSIFVINATKTPTKWVLLLLYIYHALINALSAHMIRINLNMTFYTHVEHSSTRTTHTKHHAERQTTLPLPLHTNKGVMAYDETVYTFLKNTAFARAAKRQKLVLRK